MSSCRSASSHGPCDQSPQFLRGDQDPDCDPQQPKQVSNTALSNTSLSKHELHARAEQRLQQAAANRNWRGDLLSTLTDPHRWAFTDSTVSGHLSFRCDSDLRRLNNSPVTAGTGALQHLLRLVPQKNVRLNVLAILVCHNSTNTWFLTIVIVEF
jgi:hypothetical protein